MNVRRAEIFGISVTIWFCVLHCVDVVSEYWR